MAGKLAVERLEQRQLLAANVLASAQGAILPGAADPLGNGDNGTMVQLDVDPGTPRVLIGLKVSPSGPASGLDPQTPLVLQDGVPIPTLFTTSDIGRGRHEALTLAEVVGGQTYSVVVRGQADSTGGFQVDVLLPGDLTGDAAVDQSELVHATAALVHDQFGMNSVSSLFFRQKGLNVGDTYREALDANLNGTIDAFDLASIQRNVGLTNVLVHVVSDEAAPVIQGAVSPDTGRLADDGLTNDPSFAVTGTLSDQSQIATFQAAIDNDAPDSFVDLLGPDFFTGQNFTVQPGFSLSLGQLEQIAGTGTDSLVNSGPHTLFLLAADEHGNAIETPVEISFELDVKAPSAPAAPSLVDGGTGAVGDDTPTFTVDAGDDVLVRLYSSLVDGPIGELLGNGTVTITSDSLPEGIHEITATATDAAGNESDRSDPQQIVIDTSIPDLKDFGVSPASAETDADGNPLTADPIVTVAGSTEASSTVQLLAGEQSLGTTTSDRQGNFEFSDVSLPFGQTDFTVVVTDAAGNAPTFQRTLTRDAAPEVDAPMGQRLLDVDDTAFTIDLSTVFSDADLADGDVLTFSAASDNATVAEASLDGTVLTVTPQAGQLGSAIITVRAADALGLAAEDSLTVDVAQVNDAPVITAPAEVTVEQDKEIAISGVSVSDPDLDDSGIIISLRAGLRDDAPEDLKGLMSVTPAGSVSVLFGNANDSNRISLQGSLDDINDTLATLRYQPDPGFAGSTVLTIIANDFGITGPDDVQEDEKVIDITVSANQSPVANEDTFNTGENDPISGNVLADNGSGADTDPDGDDSLLVVTNVGTLSTAMGATVTLSANGDFTYDPTGADTVQSMAAGDTRIDLFEYVVTDGFSSSTGTVVITLTGENDPPVAKDDQFGTQSTSTISGNVLDDNVSGPDEDIDHGSTLQVTSAGSLTSSLGAQVTLDADGNFTYDPLASATLQALTGSEQRTDTFEYTISDGSQTSTATVFITVTANANAEPVAWGDTAQVDGGSADNAIRVLDNDTTEAGETLTVVGVGQPTEGGSVRIGADGSSVLYTPAEGFLGTERFSYTISDGRGGTAQALATMQVTPGPPALDAHSHAELAIYVNGQPVTIPADLGFDADQLQSFIHTHDETGELHLEPMGEELPTEALTLGDFFETWRTKSGAAGNDPDAVFNENQILGNSVDAGHVIRMFVNGVPNFDFENYVIENQDDIVISYESVADPGSPTFVPIQDVTLEAGAPLHIPLDGFDFEGDSLTFTASSSDSDLVSTFIPEGNRSMRISVGDFGVMTLELFDGRVPRVTDTIAALAENGTYDGVIFHRIIQDFMIQGGDPTGTGTGDPSIPDFDDQFHVDLQHTSEGVLSMAKTSSDDTNSSQFFITAGPTRSLDFNHSVFGRLIEGENVRRAIAEVPVDDNDRPLSDVVMNNVRILVDNENAVLMLKAPEGASGQADVTITVDDGHGRTLSRTLTVTVEPDATNGGPFLEDFPELKTTVNTPLQIEVRAVDVEGDPVVFDAADVGDTTFDFTLDDDTDDPHTAMITVTPPADFVGTLQLGVAVRPEEASDTGRGFDWDTQFLDIVVEPEPSALMATWACDLADGPETSRSAVTNLTAEDPALQAMLADAVSTWQEIVGRTEPIDVRLQVADLDGGQLGESVILGVGADGIPVAERITIDADGGGAGWHADRDTAPGPDEYDLYTVLLHEVGHVLGISTQLAGFSNHLESHGELGSVITGPSFAAWLDASGDHLDAAVYPDDLMSGSLAPGERRLPSTLDAMILAAVYDDARDTDLDAVDDPLQPDLHDSGEPQTVDEALSQWG